MRLSPPPLLALLALAAGACAHPAGPGQAGYPYNVSGSYAGRFVFDGEPFDASLQLRTSGDGAVRGALVVPSPIDIEGRVEGRIVDDVLRVTISYRSADGCDGSIEGILTVESGGDSIEGPVTVTDCGAPLPGRMSFRLRERTRAPAAARDRSAPESPAPYAPPTG
jgi:hypothetical protein